MLNLNLGPRPIAAGLLIAVAIFTQAGPALADELTGRWRGHYIYNDGRPSVPFILQLSSAYGRLGGVVHEPQTFGSYASNALFGWITGRRYGATIVFAKRYDGTGGVRHTVNYRGTYNLRSRSIRGTWRTGGSVGRFVMRLTGR